MLEKDFTTCLKGIGSVPGMQVNYVAPFVKSTAARRGIHVGEGIWYEMITFANFASIVCEMITIRNDPTRVVTDVEERCVSAATELFKNVLTKGISRLEKEVSGDGYQDSLEFMKCDVNMPKIMAEWAMMESLRDDRNSDSHPFQDTASNQSWKKSIEFLEKTLEESFCAEFRHVGLLSLLKGRLVEGKQLTREASTEKKKVVAHDEAVEVVRKMENRLALHDDEERELDEIAISQLANMSCKLNEDDL